ncbi:MAG TPA: DNA-formamidopyrimidine glycosylase family protein [Verrucomicrobiae bacterium]|nr:DNA-formamidopyrimidine glycosylase family protein [Verrucomicrobiae bacterium]
MSEGPEVKIVADQISKALSNNIKIQNIIHNKLDNEMKNSIIGSYLKYVKTFGKNIVLKFSNDIYLRNHMMMWGKWRIYDKNDYDNG